MQSGWRCLGLAVTLALVVGRAVADTDEGDTMASTIIVPFGFNSAAFAPDEVQRLALADAPGAALVAVRARTSNDRATPSDEALALARALAARRYLVAHGVSPLKITINYSSASDYLVPNDTPEGRALNRRVEIEMFYVPGLATLDDAGGAAAR
ncbi:MAG TPA: OmpA family protein [Burkholderiaceae bacterium]